VTGIAVTMMATLDVLQRAAAQGSNLVITHEPTFFGHLDELAPLETAHDSVTAVKRAFIREHHMVVLRMHDHWHTRHPDGVQTGITRALGWQRFQRPEDEHLYTLPATTLGQLAADIRDRLGAPTLRVLGDPKRRVSNVAMAPGFAGFSRHLIGLRRDDVQVLVIGEAHEWETVEYVADAVTAWRTSRNGWHHWYARPQSVSCRRSIGSGSRSNGGIDSSSLARTGRPVS